MLLIYDLCDNILNVNIWCFGGRTLENEQQQIKENIENKRPGNIQMEPRKKLNKWLIITAIVLSAIAIAMVVFALVNKLNPNVYYNVYINGTDVSSMSETQVAEVVKELSDEFKKKVVTLKHEDGIVMEVTPDSIDMSVDEQATLKKIMEYGRTENIVLNKQWVEEDMPRKLENALRWMKTRHSISKQGAKVVLRNLESWISMLERKDLVFWPNFPT